MMPLPGFYRSGGRIYKAMNCLFGVVHTMVSNLFYRSGGKSSLSPSTNSTHGHGRVDVGLAWLHQVGFIDPAIEYIKCSHEADLASYPSSWFYRSGGKSSLSASSNSVMRTWKLLNHDMQDSWMSSVMSLSWWLAESWLLVSVMRAS